MTENITFLSVNVCGLSSPEKKKRCGEFLKKKNILYIFCRIPILLKKKRIIFEANGASNASLAAFSVNLAVWLFFSIIISIIN